jgi:myosin heavy subunit
MGRGSIVSISLNVSQAEENRDTVAKTLYSNMFDWTIIKVSCPCSVYV